MQLEQHLLKNTLELPCICSFYDPLEGGEPVLRIVRVLIENFRSIEKAEFYVNRFTAFVGPNNAGKSNIVCAINHVLGETYPSRRAFHDTDFFQHDPKRTIAIEVELSNRSVFRLEVPANPEEKASFSMVDSDGVKTSYVKDEHRAICPLVYLDANRNLEYHLGSSRWTLFGRVIRALHRDFVDVGGEEKQKKLSDSFDETLNILKTEKYSEFENSFVSGFAQQLRHTTHSLQLQFRTFDPQSFYANVQPVILEGLAEKSPEFLGQGMRNMILLSLFRSYAKVFRGDAVLALDEPELFLHPQAQRSLASLFRDLVAEDNQILISTHSESFLALDKFDEVVLVEKTGPKNRRVTETRQLMPAELKAMRKELHPSIDVSVDSLRERVALICGRQQSEAFFGQAVLLVEGPSEEIAFPIYAKACGLDLDAASISIVNAGGKTNLDLLFQIFEGFEIPVYMIFDNDRGDNGEKNLALNRMLLKMLGEPEEDMPNGRVKATYAVSDKDFEDAVKKGLEAIEPGLYDRLAQEAGEKLGGGSKPLRAKYIANYLAGSNQIPSVVVDVISALKEMVKEPEEPEYDPFVEEEVVEETGSGSPATGAKVTALNGGSA